MLRLAHRAISMSWINNLLARLLWLCRPKRLPTRRSALSGPGCGVASMIHGVRAHTSPFVVSLSNHERLEPA